MGVSADVMGMTAGITFSEEDTATTDTDYMLVSLTKGMGAPIPLVRETSM